MKKKKKKKKKKNPASYVTMLPFWLTDDLVDFIAETPEDPEWDPSAEDHNGEDSSVTSPVGLIEDDDGNIWEDD